MDANILGQRIADFLKKYPPFTLMAEDDLMNICQNITISYVDIGENVFTQGEVPKNFFYVVNQGAVKLVRTESEEEVLIDICAEGDLFGIRPLIAEQPYLSSAEAIEETILYKIRNQDIRQIMETNPRVSSFFATSFAAGARSNRSEGSSSLVVVSALQNKTHNLAEIQKLEITKVPVTCDPTTSIREAAKLMTDSNVGSIVITDSEIRPIGIVTDSDLRNMLGLAEVSRSADISVIMNSPVYCIPLDSSAADAQMMMLKYGISHLVITETGLDDSPVLGVLSEQDLLAIEGNNPAILIKEIKTAYDSKRLKKIREKADQLLQNYLDQEVSVAFVSDIMSKITDSIYQQAIKITLAKNQSQQKKNLDFVWVALGSHGRSEQLIRTDQDNALIFTNVPPESLETTRSYYLRLAAEVVEIMSEVGYHKCPADMMASNPKWCLSIDEWKKQFSDWIINPDNESILHSNIFMDFRPLFGDTTLTDVLSQHIFEETEDKSLFINYMAKYATSTPPPLSFFRNFILEKNGQHKNEFDIKMRGMLPLIDTARILILDEQIHRVNNTIKRYERLMKVDKPNAGLYQDAIDAYEIMLKIKAKYAFKNKDSGRFIDPNDLTKMEKLLLRNSFKPIEKLIELLKVRFQLLYFS